MKPRRVIWLPVLGCAFLAVVILLTWPRDNGPDYRGHSLHYWISEHSRASFADQFPQAEEAAQAVRQIGTNAIPHLLKWLTYEPPAWRLKVADQIARVTRSLNANLSNWILMSQGVAYVGSGRKVVVALNRRVGRALDGFAILGTQAKSAVPSLKLLASTGSNRAPESAMIALSYLGPDGLPPTPRNRHEPNKSEQGDRAHPHRQHGDKRSTGRSVAHHVSQ